MKNFSLTDAQLDRLVSKIKRRYPKENWIVPRTLACGRKSYYIRLECVAWLEEVHFNNQGFRLDREIEFLKKQIVRLESELDLSPRIEVYNFCKTGELQKLFRKRKATIFKAIERMIERTTNNYRIYQDNHVVITSEGVKWLNEKYFRKDYLLMLGNYKRELQELKREKNL